MKRSLLILLLLGALSLSPAFAADRSLYMSAGIGPAYYYLYPKDSQVRDYYSGGLAWRGFFEFKADSGLSAIGDISYFSQANLSSIAPKGTNLTIIPITASLSYRFFKDSALSPYIGGGIGIYNIKETDPDFTYLDATKFGKHIFVGLDMHISPDSILKAEIRDSFIDPASNNLYYQANFGGLTASLSLAVEWPVMGPEVEMTPEERVLAAKQRLYEAKLRDHYNRLHEMEYYYQQPAWDPYVYRRWPDKQFLYNEITKTKEQIDQEKQQAEQFKQEQERKRQEYREQKQDKRQEKKESVTGGQR